MNYVHAVRAEVTKITSTRIWWVLAIIMVGYVGLVAAGGGLLITAVAREAPLGDVSLPRLVYSFASSIGYVFPVLFGALAVTAEFRHKTLTPAFLVTPRRATVLWAKLTVLVVMGAVFGVLALIAAVGPGALTLSFGDSGTGLDQPETWLMFARILLAMALWAAIGAGLGVLVPSQVAAIVIVLAFTQFVEPILRAATSLADWASAIGRFLPGAASDALVGTSFFSITQSGGGEQLPWWGGALVLLAIAAVATAAGYFTSWRRDVD
ncbi:ABC transporter permease [Cnuibacter physcomitrellae]|uniref:ABC transporter permease n=1 Tax=Cnuibacter physcomitrellae TaxID=1619308 RepID=UPI002175EC3E|nr:ABC transporter permease [Cnuibacter physcomitrellae]MCS5495670.1 ABC transporter permease [Cnuibacter physcomitrellae]